MSKFNVYFQCHIRTWVMQGGIWAPVNKQYSQARTKFDNEFIYLKNPICVNQLFYFHTVFYNSNLYKIIYNICNVNTFYITNISIVYIHTHLVA